MFFSSILTVYTTLQVLIAVYHFQELFRPQPQTPPSTGHCIAVCRKERQRLCGREKGACHFLLMAEQKDNMERNTC